MAEPTLRSVVDLVHGWYPPGTADSWDRVGLVHGDLDQPVRRILLAVDPAPVVAQEAADWDADLLLTHHPLYLKGVHGFTSQTPKGRTSLTLAGAGCALLAAHTNADQAEGGVSEAMALALGLRDARPILPAPLPAVDKLGVMVPAEDADGMRAALAGAGAGQVGDYDHASFTVAGEGRFRPLPGADPTIGSVGEAERVDEVRIEVVFPRGRRAHVVRAMLAAHPYEEPAYDVLELADTACGSPATWTVPYAAWRCAGERATSCSTPSAAPTPTSTSPATCATTRRRSSSSTRVPPWSTSPTGPRSGPGCRCWRGGWRGRWAIRWRCGSARAPPTRGRTASDPPLKRP